MPESFTKNVRFAFLQKETAKILGCNRKFKKHGQSGMELSELLPRLGTIADDIVDRVVAITAIDNIASASAIKNVVAVVAVQRVISSDLTYRTDA